MLCLNVLNGKYFVFSEVQEYNYRQLLGSAIIEWFLNWSKHYSYTKLDVKFKYTK